VLEEIWSAIATEGSRAGSSFVESHPTNGYCTRFDRPIRWWIAAVDDQIGGSKAS
jgi:hypothetical protein